MTSDVPGNQLKEWHGQNGEDGFDLGKWRLQVHREFVRGQWNCCYGQRHHLDFVAWQTFVWITHSTAYQLSYDRLSLTFKNLHNHCPLLSDFEKNSIVIGIFEACRRFGTTHASKCSRLCWKNLDWIINDITCRASIAATKINWFKTEFSLFGHLSLSCCRTLDINRYATDC